MTISFQLQKAMVPDRTLTMDTIRQRSPQWEDKSGMKHCNVIGSVAAGAMAACPCCNRQLDDARETVGDTRMPTPRCESLFKDDVSDTDSEDWDEQDQMMPGLLSDGVAYCVKKVIAQGWVHKKGTGTDWLGSRAWKPRWAVLALVSLAGHEAYVPVLQIYWYSTSPTPTTVIHLDSAVVLPEDDADDSKWNKSRFKIQHVKKPVDENCIQMTRSFSCPRVGRDKWVYAINQALLGYEKEKAKARSDNIRSKSLSPTRPRLSWTSEHFPSTTSRKLTDLTPTPPSSPTSRPFRHRESELGQPLLGEALLGPDDE
mmetsp:Transcript_108195/g.161867  ORF Transcript_108195/g.161867 Transcript_108195/m.161867 type:complete len:314 (+) Transcript_108195:54-995(+)|eukprot:CAMPEP_0116998308 /NCGR_PEP_ID=MMETSP0472-20121206/1426_1 /TAXON_ID=693140 ORGANISM="Tiarina fusus, Strain LIS" /NCGR_SAMPLE_ID=MMETSP0472 /ASSEMBLY_ACC=CAM_ASM_000603 /LENGTH=313 /DNA_ID=CAMNT_0004697423 /DNA_START=103 /DNA_END=1044 /DNA_ORIENTATION=+